MKRLTSINWNPKVICMIIIIIIISIYTFKATSNIEDDIVSIYIYI